MNNNSLKQLFFICSLPVLTQAAIYQKTDLNGRVYFSDKPMENATLIQLQPINTYGRTLKAEKKSLQTEPEKPKNQYKTLSIAQPTDQQTFQNQREIPAILQLEPALREGDKIVWLIDGKPYQESTNTQIILKSLDRGEHQLQAKLIDANNQILIATQTVVFYVHYSTVV